MTEPVLEEEETVEIIYDSIEDFENLKLLKHLGSKFYHYNKDLRDYYYSFEKQDGLVEYYRCTDHHPKKPDRTCKALLMVRKADGHVHMDTEHTCGNTHFFLKGNPLFLPLVSYKSKLSVKPKFLENEIYAFEPEVVNIRHRWRRNVFAKAYFSFVDRRALSVLPFNPCKSKVLVRLFVRNEEGEIVEEKTMCNRGISPEIICVKPVTKQDLTRIGSQLPPGKKPSLVVVFKVPITNIVGSFDVHIFIANTSFHCEKISGIKLYKEYHEDEDSGVKLINEPVLPPTALRFYSSRTYYGSFFFEKMIKDLCAFKDPKNPVGFVTDEINLRRISRKVKKKFDEFGFNLLIHMAARGFLDIVEVLVEEEFDVNYQDHYGNTALFWAHLNKEDHVVKFLLEKGADPKILNKMGSNYELFRKRYETSAYKEYKEAVKVYMQKEVKNYNEWMMERILFVEEQMQDHGHQNTCVEQKATSIKQFSKTKDEVSNFFLGKTAKQVKQAAVSKSKQAQPVRKKTIRPAKRMVEQRGGMGSPPSAKRRRKRYGSKRSTPQKKKKNVGKKMRKVLLPNWKKDQILDWLEDIGVLEHFRAFFEEHNIYTYDELEGLLTKDDEFFENIDPRHRKVLLLHVIYLQKCRKLPKPSYQQKDPQIRSYLTMLQKVLANKDFSGVTRFEIEDFVTMLTDPQQLKDTLKVTRDDPKIHSMKARLVILNDSFVDEPLRVWIKQAYQKDEDKNRIRMFPFTSRVFITGLLLGDVLLTFSKNGIVFPRRVSEDINCSKFDVTELQIADFEDRYITQVTQTIVRWNRDQKYDKKNSNCYQFCEEVLKKCLLVREITMKSEAALYSYFENMKKQGECLDLPLETNAIGDWDHKNSMNVLRIFGYHKLLTRFEYVGRRLYGRDFMEMKKTDPLIQEMVVDDERKTSLMCLINNVSKTEKFRKFKFNINFPLSFLKNEKYLFQTQKTPEEFEGLLYPWIKKEVFIEKFMNQVKKPTKGKDLEIEILLTQVSFDFVQQLGQTINAALVHQFSYQIPSDQLMTAVTIGPWFLAWNSHSMVIPHYIPANDMKKLRTQIQSRVRTSMSLDQVKNKIAYICTEWNGKLFYGKTFVQGRHLERNSQAFVDEILESLGVFKKIEDSEYGPFYELIDNVRQGGMTEMYFSPDPEFVNFFQLAKNKGMDAFKIDQSNQELAQMYGEYKIMFETHAFLDEFVNDLFKQANLVLDALTQKFPSEFRILKSFDRAFWMRFRKEPVDKFRQTTKVKTGCPFKK